MLVILPRDSTCLAKSGVHTVPEVGAPTRSRAGVWLCAAGLLVLVLLVGNINLLLGKRALQWDSADFFAPAYSLVADHLKAHRLLLWNPWISGGSPDFAEPELGTTSPIMLLTAAIFPGPESGYIAYWMLTWIGAGLGMLLFAKHLGAPPWGAAISALGFIASGFFVGHAQHMSSLFSIAFLPWICWRLDDALVTRRYWSAVEAGVLYGLSGLGGYPQFTILTPGFLGLWTIGRLLFRDKGDAVEAVQVTQNRAHRVPRAVAYLALIGAVGILIFSPPYLGFATETHGYSDRIGPRARAESIGSGILPAEAISTLSSPYLFLLSYPGPGRIWPESDVSMSDIYSGSAVVVLALFALLIRSRWRYWLAAVALFFLAASLGNQLPLRGWIYDWIPLTRFFRNASMFSIYTIFVLCTLCSLAARDIEKPEGCQGPARKKLFVLTFVIVVAAAISFGIVLHKAPALPFQFDLAMVHFAIAWFGILAAALMVARNLASTRRFAHLLVAVAVCDALIAIVISAPAMYSDTAMHSSWRNIVNRDHVSNLDMTAGGLNRQLHPPEQLTEGTYVNNRNVPLKTLVLHSYNPFYNRFESSVEQDPLLREFALGKDRIWFSERPLFADVTNDSYSRFAAKTHELGQPIMVLHNPAQMRALVPRTAAPTVGQSVNGNVASEFAHAEPASAAAVDLLGYRPNSVQFRYDAPKPGWLMMTDRWAPGWQAEVNGRPEAVYGADFLFRGIRVEAGMNTITFRYRPRTWLVSIIISWGTLLLLAALEAWRLCFSRNKRVEHIGP